MDFTLILPPIDEVTCAPVQVAGAYTLDRATDDQVGKLQAYLDASAPRRLGAPLRDYFESTYERTGEHQGVPVFVRRGLGREAWRYFVLAHGADAPALHDMQLAANVADVELRFGVTLYDDGMVSADEAVLFHMVSPVDLPAGGSTLSLSDIDRLNGLIELVQQVSANYPSIRRSLDLFHRATRLDKSEGLAVLGLFTAIESLITHKQRSSESGDSLRHQVSKKMPLLQNRLDVAFSGAAYFGEMSENTMWAKLYDYRSCVAHGSEPNFEKELAALRRPACVYDFLRAAAKATLRQALREPQLLMDLKEC